MKHELRITGRRFALRPVERGDAEFIVSLRSDPELGKYLHATSPHVADQVAWITAYEQRADDYYFVVTDERLQEPAGTVGIYGVANRAAEWGRWLIKPGSLAAVESALLVFRIGFEQLGLDRLHCRTVAENAKVVSFHDSLGALRGPTLKQAVFLSQVGHDAIEHTVSRELWTALRPRLERLAARVAEVRDVE